MDKKELIRNSAIKVIAAEGYHNTTVKMIAQKAEIAVGTIYNYFSNKGEILNYIFEVEFNKRIELLQQLKQKNISLKEKIMIFLDKHFADLKANSDTATVLIQESKLPRKHSLEAINNFMNKLPDLLAKIIDQAREKEEIRIVNSQLVANIIFHTIRGVATKVVKDNKLSFTEAKKELLDQIWFGLSK
ncbi:transcriptional regulator [Halobacteroides halobius DSM 5150]|uniref:Transcriptional regulator n=1 Tax=Halobacteroides halobius (strain ATCC 35273 / DSM 5150 / MD-1) TaxID=748449 RepID=L0K9W8_HALHC|nr:TetR/AcrR family transcriptional regulator [Halobacteroides halobius]AGB41174.1 transcriptional regulator [Halobacteroides halobius DSM 5150]